MFSLILVIVISFLTDGIIARKAGLYITNTLGSTLITGLLILLFLVFFILKGIFLLIEKMFEKVFKGLL